MRVLTPRSNMTGADRAWVARYQTGDVLHYSRGSKELGIERGSYAAGRGDKSKRESIDRA